MSALTEQVAREHWTDSGISCRCGHYPTDDVPLNADRTRHLIEATEQAARAHVAAEIDALEVTRPQVQAGVRAGNSVDYYTGWGDAVSSAARVARRGAMMGQTFDQEGESDG